MKGLFLFICLTALVSCKNEVKDIVVTSEDFHLANDELTRVMVYDIFSPPVASRVYAYSNIAAYEVMAALNPEFKSLSGKVTGLSNVPAPETSENLNAKIAAIVALYDVGSSLVFSEEMLAEKRDSVFNSWKDMNEESFITSRDYGLKVAGHIKDWMKKDNYAETRTMPKFTVKSDDVSRWQPTPPNYMDGIEPHWSKIRPFVLKTADQFKPIRPPEFSMEPDSKFHKELMEVYTIRERIAEDEENSKEMSIARFWDCNPYVSISRGHLMFATKKITPGGHWMGITKIACKKTGADFDNSVYAYAKTAIAIADGFISCWDEKYRSNLVRPETLINKFIDEDWKSVLQTPPFPEYTSGHSVVSGAASVALTNIFGDNFNFEDDTEVLYGLPIRNFDSFYDASQEAANSRLYGGIHYRAAVEVGLEQGKNLGNYLISELQMKANGPEVANR